MSTIYLSQDGLNEKFQQGYCPSYSVTIADDDVAEIAPPRNGGMVSIMCAGESVSPLPQFAGVIYYDVGTTLNVSELVFAGLGANLATSTSDVTGTTGVDGNTTVAVQSGVIKIENRTAASRTYQVTFL